MTFILSDHLRFLYYEEERKRLNLDQEEMASLMVTQKGRGSRESNFYKYQYKIWGKDTDINFDPLKFILDI